MADCFPPDVDDLHRRWLPREIFADIGIADAAPPSADAAVEDVAVHLTAVLGGKKEAPPRPPPPPPGPAPYHQYHQATQVGGLQVQGAVLMAYGYGGVVPAPWPFLPYPPLQWQFTTTNFGNGGGRFPGAPAHAPSRPIHHGPPPTKRRLGGTGGTGVFLPRAQEYQYQHKAANKSRSPPAKDGKPAKEWRQQQPGGDDDEVAGLATQQNSSAALLALPQEWTY